MTDPLREYQEQQEREYWEWFERQYLIEQREMIELQSRCRG